MALRMVVCMRHLLKEEGAEKMEHIWGEIILKRGFMKHKSK